MDTPSWYDVYALKRSAPVVVSGDDLIPVGTGVGTAIFRVPAKATDVKVTHVSNNKSEPVSGFELPDNLAIGDVVMALATTQSAGRSFAWVAPWEEVFDYTQSRTSSAAIYRIVDQAALDAIEPPTFTPQGNFDSIVLVTIKLKAITAPWPAYGAGNGRSSNTINNVSNTGFSVNAIGASPFAAFDTEYAFVSSYSGIVSGPGSKITLPEDFEILVDASTGGVTFVIGRRPATTLPRPVFDVAVEHPVGWGNALYGGGHFVVPSA